MTAHKKLVLAILLFAVIGMIGLSTAVQGGVSNSPALNYTAAGVEPNPQLNVNATYSTFYHNYKPLEYYNGTGNATLHAGLSNYYKNPITVNPTDIKSKALQNDNLSTAPVWDASAWGQNSLGGGAVGTNGVSGTSIYQTANTSDSAGNSANQFFTIPVTNFPSNNPNYDFITIIIQLSGPQITGVNGQMYLWNSTNDGNALLTIFPGQYTYISESLGTFEKDNGYATTFNTSGKGKTTYLKINSQLNIPETSTAATYNMSIIGLAFGTTPMTLGTQENNGSLIQINQLNQTGRLQTFNPDFAWTSVSNSGYTIALSQSLQNATISQSSINDGKYVESATYQGVEQLPSAPDLTYGNANITMPVALPGTQYKVLNVNGQSYTNTVSTMDNGTFTAGSVNPTHANEIIIQVYYTSAQWNSVSSPPGFFSNPVATIEYYWYIFLGVALGAIGLGAGIKGHAQGFRGAKR